MNNRALRSPLSARACISAMLGVVLIRAAISYFVIFFVDGERVEVPWLLSDACPWLVIGVGVGRYNWVAPPRSSG